MYRSFLAGCPVALLVVAGACSADTRAVEPTASTALGGAAGPAPATQDCPVTPPIAARPPDPSPPRRRDPLPPGRYHRSPDGKIWAPGNTFAPIHVTSPIRSVKVLWLKPVGSRLAVSGRRLDGAAPPLDAHLPEGYPWDFQASRLTFPTEGCWEVEARADDSLLRFVVYIP